MQTGWRVGVVSGVCLVVGCSTYAEKADRADEGNIIFSIHDDEVEVSQPGEYSSGGGDSRKPGVVVAHSGRATAFRAHQSGTGTAAQIVADDATNEAPALDVRSAGQGPAVRFAGGRVALGEGATLVLESIVHVRAADAIELPAGASVVVIDATEGVQANNVRTTPRAEGQLLWVLNDDDGPVSIGTHGIPPGELHQLVYLAGAFRPVN